MDIEEILTNEINDPNVKECLVTYSPAGGCNVYLTYIDDSKKDYSIQCSNARFRSVKARLYSPKITFIDYSVRRW